MQKKMSIILIVMLGFGVVASVSHSADCQQIAQDIKQERNFMKRKVLVEKAFGACPDDASIVFKYALSKERYNEPEEALKYYTKAAVLDPDMAKAYFGMADVYVALEKKDMAVMAYAKGLTLDPTNVRAIRSKTALEAELPRTNPRAGIN
jgi:tetratricopeptide (TPR) repeat protein